MIDNKAAEIDTRLDTRRNPLIGLPDPVLGQIRMSGIKPGTSDVISAYTNEIYYGDGSLVQDVNGLKIEETENYGAKLTEEDWKKSPYARPGLTWYPDMTNESARLLAEIQDERAQRNNIFAKATGLQTAVGLTAGLVAGVAEPKNVASGLAIATVTGGVGIAVPALRTLLRINTIRRAAIAGAVEGLASAAITEPSNIESARVVQSNYDINDTLLNFGLSAVFGAGLGALSKKVSLRRAQKSIEEFDTTLMATISGSKPEAGINLINKIYESQDRPEIISSLPPRAPELDEAIVRYTKTDDGFYKADVPDERGLIKSIDALGETQEAALANLKAIYSNPFPFFKDRYNDVYLEKATNLTNVNTQLKEVETALEATKQQMTSSRIRQYSELEQQLEQLQKLPISIKNQDNINKVNGAMERLKNVTDFRKRGDFDNRIVKLEEQRKSLKDTQTLLKQEFRELKKIIFDRDNPGIIRKYIEDLETSTTQEPNVAAAVADNYEINKNKTDDLITQESMEDLRQDLIDMDTQGLLSKAGKEQVANLESIKKQLTILDNIYRHAKLCLVQEG